MIVAFLAEISAIVDAKVRSFLRAGDREAALRVVLDVFGTELRGFVFALLRDERAASAAYAQLREDLRSGLQSYRGEATVRTWSYALARRAALRERARRRRDAPTSDAVAAELLFRSSISEPRGEAKVTPYPRPRQDLSEDDRELVLLRVDRAFGWEEIARIVVMGEASAQEDQEIALRAARLQKRFDELKTAFVRDHAPSAAPQRRASRSRA